MEKDSLTYQQRVVEEYQEVKERTSKLSSFILDNPVYPTLSDEEKEDLEIQYRAMCDYVDALDRRVSKF